MALSWFSSYSQGAASPPSSSVDQDVEEEAEILEVDEMELIDPLPAPTPRRSNSSAQQIPQFPLLLGEHPLLISKTTDGNAMVTNFRFCVCEYRNFINIPLMMVGDLLVIEAAKRLRIGCKDGSTYICSFATTEDCTMCSNELRERTGQPSGPTSLFAYRFYKWATQKGSGTAVTSAEQDQVALCKTVPEAFAYTFGKEVERLGFDTNRKRIWKMSHANENFEFCSTYPKLHILPASVEDDKLKVSLDFRALKRFPSVVWRDRKTGMVLIRSSQPLSSFLGVSYYQNHADVFLIEEIVNACNRDREFLYQENQRKAGLALPESEITEVRGQEEQAQQGDHGGSLKNQGAAQGSLVAEHERGHGASNGQHLYDENCSPRKLAIVDCRSLAGVWGNSFKGGGTEDEVVYKCNTVHLDLANIHNVRDSFNRLRTLCHTYVEGTYYKNLTASNWLTYISALLRGANIVVELMHVKQRPVLVHCSDGWDRTSQIVSLSELMMDPYYRTLEGFQVLVEREWLHFGHKFGERGGHDPNCSDTNQISPIFLQFLDCVYQLTLQYPAEFQFNEAYLVKLLKHSQACLFGTFLHNCPRERENCPQKTASVWALLIPENMQFVNLLYKPAQQVLTAKYSEHDMVLWKSVYMAGQSPWPHGSQTDFFSEASLAGGGEDVGNAADGIHRSKSMDDMSKLNSDSGRRSSDPSATQILEIAAAAPGTTAIHDTSSSSAEILHYPEDSPPVGAKLSPTSRSEEAESPRKSPANLSNSIKNTDSSGRENSSPPKTQFGTLVVDVEPPASENETPGVLPAATAQNQSSSTPDAAHGSPEWAQLHGTSEASLAVHEIGSINGTNRSLLEDTKTHNLLPSSSAVFSQEEASTVSVVCTQQTLCCNPGVETSSDSQVLSSETHLSTLKVSDGHLEVSNSASNVDASGASVEQSSPTNGRHKMLNSTTSNANAKQTSLLSERLASSPEVSVSDRIQGNNANNVSDKMTQANREEELQHSRTLDDISDHRAMLKARIPREVSKKIVLDSSPTASWSNGKHGGSAAPKSGAQESHSMAINGSPSKAISGTKTDSSSVSTDTLTDEIEARGGDSMSPSTPVSSKPMEVNTRRDRHLSTPPQVSSSSSLSSPLKRDGYPSDVNETTSGPNLLSRRARAASGASRDYSMSPSMPQCACRGNWSDTGRLRHPSGGEMVSRTRWLGASVATSTTDISDSYVRQELIPTNTDRQQSIKQHVDVDGLTFFCDERQDLLTELVTEKDRKISELENRLVQAIHLIKSARCRNPSQPGPPPALLDELLNDDNEGGEHSSLGATSNPASDASWETIEESEAKVVLWVPDSVVTHCAGCDRGFWLARRKHHCRNCGKVFCAECSNYMAPVPDQHLNKPERVCRRCHSDLLQLSPGASSDGRIPTLVADG